MCIKSIHWLSDFFSMSRRISGGPESILSVQSGKCCCGGTCSSSNTCRSRDSLVPHFLFLFCLIWVYLHFAYFWPLWLQKTNVSSLLCSSNRLTLGMWRSSFHMQWKGVPLKLLSRIWEQRRHSGMPAKEIGCNIMLAQDPDSCFDLKHSLFRVWTTPTVNDHRVKQFEFQLLQDERNVWQRIQNGVLGAAKLCRRFRFHLVFL